MDRRQAACRGGRKNTPQSSEDRPIPGAPATIPGSRMTKKPSLGNQHGAARGSGLGVADRSHFVKSPPGHWKPGRSLRVAEPRFDLQKLIPNRCTVSDKWENTQLDGRVSKPSPGRSWGANGSMSLRWDSSFARGTPASLVWPASWQEMPRGRGLKNNGQSTREWLCIQKRAPSPFSAQEMEGGKHKSLLVFCTGK